MWCGRRRAVPSLRGGWRSCWRSCWLSRGVRAAGVGRSSCAVAGSCLSLSLLRGRRALVASGGLWRSLARLWSVGRAALCSRPCRRLVASGGWLAAGGCWRRASGALSRSWGFRLLTYLLTYYQARGGCCWRLGCCRSAVGCCSAVGCRLLSTEGARSIDPRASAAGLRAAAVGGWPAVGRAVQVAGLVRGDEVLSLLID